MTAEIGRQPWLVYGLMRTADGYSKTVSAGNGWFTLIGFMGMYTVLASCFCFWCAARSSTGRSRSGRRRSELRTFSGGAITMATLWFMLVAVMLTAYVVLDGFDLGAGAIHLFVAKNDEERRR